ncbi:MAG TPA: transglutaminase-like domain-containing protein [Gemmatimonadaceae bacterium]|nr:transglutaminase-like domain-containing protein [Gemmatimonadaceae bacterium]
MRRPGRRASIAIGILVLWLAGLGVLVQRELFRPHAEHLAEAGMRVTPSATFFAVLQRGEQIGFASSTVDTTDGGITQEDYLVADLAIAGKLHRASARTSVKLSRGLRLRSFSLDVDADLAPIKAAGTVVGDSLLLLTVDGVAGQPTDTQRVRLTGPVLLPTLLPIAVALGQRPRPGATYTLPVFDPRSMSTRDMQVAVLAESVFVLPDSSVFDAATKRWLGARPDTIRAWKLGTPATSAASGSSGFDGWVDEQGRLVLVNQLLGLTLERRPYEVAFENWKADALKRGTQVTADRDIYEMSAISANKRLRKNLAELKVRLTGVELDRFDVKGYRQKLRGDTLTITREDASALRATYGLPNGARSTVNAVFLDAEPLLESDNPAIRSLAIRLRGAEKDPAVVAERINRWVYDSLRKEITVGVPSALATLRSRVGDCNEHTQLAVALLRAAGIPARVAAGLAYVDDKFYYHAWPEVWLERWVAADPTFGQFPADASHLRFTVGGLGRQAELLRLMGALHVDVISAH